MGINEKWDNNDIEERKLEGRGNNEPKKERKNKKREEKEREKRNIYKMRNA